MATRRYLPLFLALPLLLLPIGDVVIKRQEIAGFVREEGAVVALVRTSCAGGAGRECWFPVIEYQVSPGRTNRIRSDVASFPAPVVGSRVTLLVNPRDPYDARVGGLSGYWARSFVTSSIALGFFLLAVLAVVFPKFNVRRPTKNNDPNRGPALGLFADVTGSRGAVPGVVPVGAAELREALLALNRDDLPWSIGASQRADVDLLAALKFEDPLWGKRIHGANINWGIRIFLRLDPDTHSVRSIDEKFTVEWHDGIAQVALRASLARGDLTLQRGQLTQRVNETTFGRRADGSFGRKDHFQFDSAAMKEALRQVVTQHGWQWHGMIFGRP